TGSPSASSAPRSTPRPGCSARRGRPGRPAPSSVMTDDAAPALSDPEAGLVALAERLQASVLAAGWTVATAESCTGGLVAHAITQVAGSSGYLAGGVVAYSDAVKVAQLGVPQAVLDAHGAVSAQVARSMA